ncbi:MAG: DUF3298 and DUF4163 domain-containing protein [Fimbriimonadaceae bacterium]|nr:DUF3298 and DUF4163 domain-containing protein [Fimbriimonadaceae bacterium]
MLATLIAASVLVQPTGTQWPGWNIAVPEKYETKGTYPVLPGATPLTVAANNGVRAAVMGPRDEFLNSAKKFWAQESSSAPWAQEITVSISRVTPNLISVWVETYEYAGGAHPNTNRQVLGWILRGRTVERLGFQHFISSRNDRIAFAQMSLLPRLNDEKRERGLDTLEEFNYDYLNRFVVTEKGLNWKFDRYQLGSYAEGDYEVTVPFSEILSFGSATTLARELSPRTR